MTSKSTKHNKILYAGLCLILGVIYPMWLVSAPIPAAITLNMKGADITAFIGTVAKQTNKNFIVDPRVKGKVTLISHRPLNKKALYQVFLSVLEVHGFTAVPGGGDTVKIVPIASAKHSGIPTVRPNEHHEGDEPVTQVLEIKHVPAAQLVPILRPLVPPQGHLAAYPPSNVLIISDSANNIERILNIIERIDKKTSDEIEVIQLDHASAKEVVNILNNLNKARGKKDPSSNHPTIVADERTNSVLLGGDPAARLRIRAIISHLDTPLDSGGNIHVVYLKYANAKDLVPVLTGVGKSEVKGKQVAGGRRRRTNPTQKTEFTIQADESSNALVISSPPDIMRSLHAVIRKLDVRRAQVMVEAIIAEVSLNKSAELGVEWVLDGTPGGQRPVSLTNFPGGQTTSLANLASAAISETAPALGAGISIGIGRLGHKALNFGVLLSALKGDGESNILSTPNIVTLDNVEAEINVGQEVPFVTGSFTSAGNTGSVSNPFQTIQRKPVGITLKVKPQINEGDAIRLDIEQKIDSLSASAVGAVDLITNTRTIKTSVMVDDGQTLVLGGLIKDDLKESVQKVPLLGDIPILGALFRKKSTTKEKINLMVFLRPIILRNAQDAYDVSSEKYNYFRAQQLEKKSKGVSLMHGEEMPVLPELKKLEQEIEMSSAEGNDEMGERDSF